jgi:hypothetical protein
MVDAHRLVRSLPLPLPLPLLLSMAPVCTTGVPSGRRGAVDLVTFVGAGRVAERVRGACPVDVRIGIVQSVKELDVELAEDTDRDKVLADIETMLADQSGILWLTDRKGRKVGVPAAKVAYVEVDAPSSERHVGFRSS